MNTDPVAHELAGAIHEFLRRVEERHGRFYAVPERVLDGTPLPASYDPMGVMIEVRLIAKLAEAIGHPFPTRKEE